MKCIFTLSIFLCLAACDDLPPLPEEQPIDATVDAVVDAGPARPPQMECPSAPRMGCVYNLIEGDEGVVYLVIRPVNWDFYNPPQDKRVFAWFAGPTRDFTCCYDNYPKCMTYEGEVYFTATSEGDNTNAGWTRVEDTTCDFVPPENLPEAIYYYTGD